MGLQHAAKAAASADSIMHFLDFYIFFAPIFWLLFFAHQWKSSPTHGHTRAHTLTRGTVDFCGQRDFYCCAHSLRSNLVFLFSFISRFLCPYFALLHSLTRTENNLLLLLLLLPCFFFFAHLRRCDGSSLFRFVLWFFRFSAHAVLIAC